MTKIEICALGERTPEKKATAKQMAVEKKAKQETVSTEKPTVAKANPDDLKKVEGIDPKIAEVLTQAGIDTLAKLAQADVVRLKEILTNTGSRYASRNPAAWPEQARLAAEGKWNTLKTLQEGLRGAAGKK